MKNTIIQNIKPILLALILVGGVSYASAAWTVAPASPPSGNVPAPINVGVSGVPNTVQLKNDSLTIAGVLSTINFVATNIFKFDPDTDPSGGTRANRTNKVLTALDANGTIGWVAAAGAAAVTKIIAGNNIVLSPATGLGDVTVSANSVFPTKVGRIGRGATYSFGSDWKVIMLNGQYDPASGGGSDSSPAGGFIIKKSTGQICWSLFSGQRSGTAEGVNGGETGEVCGVSGTSTDFGVSGSGANITITVTGASVQVNTGGSGTTGGTYLNWVVLN